MKRKLTLRLDERLIKRAKARAKEKGTSVSQMVADYFALIDAESTRARDELPPVTASLDSILKDSNINEDDYRTHLEEKHHK